MNTFRAIRAFIHNVRHGWLSVLIFYIGLTGLSYAAYFYLGKLPEAHGIVTAAQLWSSRGSMWAGLSQVWFIFAWGFGIQSLLQIWRVVRRKPRDADMGRLLKHGVWMSANAGLFEELVFRLYAFLSFVIALHYLNNLLGGFVQTAAVKVLLPAANFLTLGFLKPQFIGADWALGLAIIIGSLFFRSAHIHYGKLGKANVWLIGMVMFWLVFNYGLATAIAAHFLYDLCVFTAITLTSPLQPRPNVS